MDQIIFNLYHLSRRIFITEDFQKNIKKAGGMDLTGSIMKKCRGRQNGEI